MFAISPTDIEWFKYLRNKGFNSEVNFWTPSPWNVSKLKVEDKLYFMLKSPIRKIGGYGQFLEYKNMTVGQAWNNFGFKNGCSSKLEFFERIEKYNKSNKKIENIIVENTEIGCIVLTNVKYFDDNSFINLDDYEIDFSRYIVKIKYYDQYDPLTLSDSNKVNDFELISLTTEKLKKSRLVTPRKGQGLFRAQLTEAYSNKCCISNESTVELLEAAHIQPYVDENSNHIKNGLLLRVDFHKMYDNGLMYINDKFKIYISPQVKSEYYQSFNGKRINLPINESFYPSKKALKSRKFEYRNEK